MADASRNTRELAGAPARDRILDTLRTRLKNAGSPTINLATVLVGNDGPSQRYVASKHKTAHEVGIGSVQVEFPASVTQAELNDKVAELAASSDVHGILVQMPLPEHLDAEQILRLIPADKDVDG